MRTKFFWLFSLVSMLFLSSCNQGGPANQAMEDLTDTIMEEPADTLVLEGEKHIQNVRMLTNGGDNAEAYFSFDNSMAVFQSNYDGWGVECDQIFYVNFEEDDLINNQPKMLSTGMGRTTCSYFMPGDTTVLVRQYPFG